MRKYLIALALLIPSLSHAGMRVNVHPDYFNIVQIFLFAHHAEIDCVEKMDSENWIIGFHTESSATAKDRQEILEFVSKI